MLVIAGIFVGLLLIALIMLLANNQLKNSSSSDSTDPETRPPTPARPTPPSRTQQDWSWLSKTVKWVVIGLVLVATYYFLKENWRSIENFFKTERRCEVRKPSIITTYLLIKPGEVAPLTRNLSKENYDYNSGEILLVKYFGRDMCPVKVCVTTNGYRQPSTYVIDRPGQDTRIKEMDEKVYYLTFELVESEKLARKGVREVSVLVKEY